MFAAQLSVLAACATTPPPPPISSTPPPPVVREGGAWTANLLTDHPLVGRIWSRAKGDFVDRATFERELAAARYVLLGEKHDAPDHHRLQRELIASLTAKGRTAAVVFEMVDADAQSKLDEARKDGADAMAEATGWNKGGWDWPLYKPIVTFALEQSLPIVAGNYPRAKFMGVPIDKDDEQRLLANVPYPEGEEAMLRAELIASHCGMLPEDRVPKMVAIQRLRDGQMAERMVSVQAVDTVVLVAGSGHTRADRGVPWVLRKREPGAKIASVAFLEVEPKREVPGAYAEHFHVGPASKPGGLPFDYVWFTPALADEDPCAKMH